MKEFKPGDRVTLKDGTLVEVMIAPEKLLGIEDTRSACNRCCLLHERCDELLGYCTDKIGYHEYLKRVE